MARAGGGRAGCWDVEKAETHSKGQYRALSVTQAPQTGCPRTAQSHLLLGPGGRGRGYHGPGQSPEHSTLTNPPSLPKQAEQPLHRRARVRAACGGHGAVWVTVVYLCGSGPVCLVTTICGLRAVLATALGSPSAHQEPAGTPWSQAQLQSRLGQGPRLAASWWREDQEDERPHTRAPTETSKVPSTPSATE